MEPATPIREAAEAITGLRDGLAASGIAGTYACDAVGSAMPAAPARPVGPLMTW